MKTDKDILRDTPHLKTMPFSTPENYFEGLKSQMKVCQKSSAAHSPATGRIKPYFALAAAFALLVAAGGFFLSRSGEMDFTQEDYIVFSEDMTNSIFYDSDELYIDVVTEDDIMEYLVYNDIDLEEIY